MCARFVNHQFSNVTMAVQNRNQFRNLFPNFNSVAISILIQFNLHSPSHIILSTRTVAISLLYNFIDLEVVIDFLFSTQQYVQSFQVAQCHESCFQHDVVKNVFKM